MRRPDKTELEFVPVLAFFAAERGFPIG
jgi:hypothetical protein